MKRIPPSGMINQLFQDALLRSDATDLTGGAIMLGARKVIQELLEEEVASCLGRGMNERRSEDQQGLRNGYKQRRLDCAEGRLATGLPQVQGLEEPWRSELWEILRRRTEVLERLVVEM